MNCCQCALVSQFEQIIHWAVSSNLLWKGVVGLPLAWRFLLGAAWISFPVPQDGRATVVPSLAIPISLIGPCLLEMSLASRSTSHPAGGGAG